MNKFVTEKWLPALRSGEFKQIRGTLCNLDNSYCCLGVAAKVAWDNVSDDTLYRYIRDLIGVDRQGSDCLVKLNDVERLSFSEIADYIEAHPDLFKEDK
jgi:hypothetical protein